MACSKNPAAVSTGDEPAALNATAKIPVAASRFTTACFQVRDRKASPTYSQDDVPMTAAKKRGLASPPSLPASA